MTEFIEVSELANFISKSLPKTKINLIGEISGYKFSNSHSYFNLKDNKSLVPIIIWKTLKSKILLEEKEKYGKNEDFKDGDTIKVTGHLDYYAPYGKVSFITDKFIEKTGKGDFFKIIEERRKKLEKKGYFDSKNKKKIDNFIKKICVLTSKEGAALQDFLYVINNSNINFDIKVINVLVQGKDSSQNISSELDTIEEEYDLIIITRGGGGIEDMIHFSNLDILESIYKQKNKVLTAIGHQVDETLSDLVADISKPTPSLAGEFIVSHNITLLNNLDLNLSEVKCSIEDKFLEINNTINRIEKNLGTEQHIFKDVVYQKKNNIYSKLSIFEKKLLEIENKLNSQDMKLDIEIKQTISGKNKIINTKEDFLKKIKKNKEITIVFPDGEVTIETNLI